MNKLKEGASIYDVKDYLIEYVSKLNNKQSEFLEDFVKDFNEEELLEFINELIDNGIPICQEPFWDNINIIELGEIFDFYEIQHIRFENIINNLTAGELYFIRLILAALYSNI